MHTRRRSASLSRRKRSLPRWQQTRRELLPAGLLLSSWRIQAGEREQGTMNTHCRYRAVLVLGTVGLLLTGVCGLWLWSHQRQEALNRQLIAVLVKGDFWRRRQQEPPYDYQEALSLVNAGADPNTPLKPLPAPSLRQLCKCLIHRSPLPVNHSPTAFLMACGAYWGESSDRPKLHIVDGENPGPLIQAMLKHRANTEVKGGEVGWTPLIYAAYEHHIKTVNVLLEHGVDTNAKAEDGGLPLYWAMYCSVNNASSSDLAGTSGIVLSLLAHGAAPNLPDRNGTLLQFAAYRPYLVTLLKHAGAKK